jgi:hypothetical protein
MRSQSKKKETSHALFEVFLNVHWAHWMRPHGVRVLGDTTTQIGRQRGAGLAHGREGGFPSNRTAFRDNDHGCD